MDVEKWCILKTNVCPKKYRFIINTQLLSHSANAYSSAKMGNSVKVNNPSTRTMREKYIVRAYTETQAFVSQLSVIYDVCKSDFITDNELLEISELAFEALKLLNGLMKSDKERYKDV